MTHSSTPNTSLDSAPLEGMRIAVTASRRADDQIAALERHGAHVTHAPTMRIVPVENDAQLVEETHALLAAAPATFFVTTGQGINSWLEILDESLRQDVLSYLASTRVICRGAKGRGAIRKWGLPDSPSSEKETSRSMVELALDIGIDDGPIGLQRHGYVPDSALVPLGKRDVFVVGPYRWENPPTMGPMRELIDSAIARDVDAVTFTAAPAVESLVREAEAQGKREALIDAFRSDVRVVAVGHVTAEPLKDLGLSPLFPQRERLGAMVKAMVDEWGSPRA